MIVRFFTDDLSSGLLFAIPSVILGYFISIEVDGYISSRYPDCLYTPFEIKRDYAAARIQRREELKETMLLKMQYMQGLEHTIAELNKIFNANNDLKLNRWVVFRSWYKDQIDYMLQHPDIYNLSVDGEPYVKEDDPLYDPVAPDWSLYGREHYYEYEDYDRDGDGTDYYGKTREGNDAAEAEKRQMLRDNLEAWNELNKDFIEEMNREVDKEIDDLSDVSKHKKGNGYNYYDFT